jgi:hypothetical protein
MAGLKGSSRPAGAVRLPALAQLGHLDQRERESSVTDEARPALVR